MNTLERLSQMIKELNSTNSSNEKKVILAKYGDLKEILNIIYSDFYVFHVTSDNLLKKDSLDLDSGYYCQTIEELLIGLSNGTLTGHEAIRTVWDFINANTQYQDLILNILDKNLKCRTDSKLINSVFPDAVQTFDVALAKSLDKVSKKPNFEKETWFASRKLDGCRCIVIKKGDDVKAFSRTGKPFETLQVILDEIRTLPIEEAVFDGELCLIENGVENFQGVMKVIRRKDYQIENPKYNIFDLLTMDEFTKKEGDVVLSERLLNLSILSPDSKGFPPHLSVLKQTVVKDQKHFEELVEEGKVGQWEGIMIRKDCGYEGKRSSLLLKVKSFFDQEFEVVGLETGPFRIIENGKEIEIETMTSVKIMYRGNVVGVGSGFSIEERRRFFETPSEILHKIITVKYFSESVNEKGEYSLRFPTVKFLYSIKRED